MNGYMHSMIGHGNKLENGDNFVINIWQRGKNPDDTHNTHSARHGGGRNKPRTLSGHSFDVN